MGATKRGSAATRFAGVFAIQLIIALVGFIPGAFGISKDEMAALWNDTPFRATHAIQTLNDVDCRKSLEYFMGCMRALEEIAEWLPEPLELTIEGQNLVFADAKKDKPEAKNLREHFYMERDKRDALLKAITQMYSTPGQGGVSFEKLATELFGQVESKYEAMVAAQAMNQLFHYVYDPHTNLNPAKFMQMQAESGGDDQFVGIGVSFSQIGDRYVLDPMEDSAAAKAGIQRYDILTHVDGKDVSKLTILEIAKLIRGEENTPVQIGLMRENAGPVTITVVRQKITRKNVTGEVFEFNGKKYGHITLRSFSNEAACGEVKAAIESVTKAGAVALVMDVRGNPGGNVAVAVCIADLFLPANSVVTTFQPVIKDAPQKVFRTKNRPFTSLPMAILIDGHSASASELLAGALQDHNRAWVIGERSFGKGTAQQVMPFFPNVFGDSITISRTIWTFHQPSGRTNQVYGIVPDIEVAYKPDATAEERFILREADLYENAIANNNGEYRSSREREISTLKSRMTGAAEKAYDKTALDERRDFQLLKAAEVLSSCDSLVLAPPRIQARP